MQFTLSKMNIYHSKYNGVLLKNSGTKERFPQNRIETLETSYELKKKMLFVLMFE